MGKNGIRETFFSKVLKFVLTLVIVLNSCAVPVFATENQTTSVVSSDIADAIMEALDFVSLQKEQYGLGDVDFETLSVGEKISAYEYVEDKLCEMDFQLYPLLSDGNIVAFAVKDDKKTSVDITTALVEEVNSKKPENEDFALIYDKDSCYLYTLDRLNKIYEDMQMDDGRGDFGSDNISASSLLESVEIEDDYNIQSLDYCETVNASQYKQSRAEVPKYYSLSVPYVSQATNSSYCWASCVASIGNYFTNQRNTGEYVAIYVFGTSYNKGATGVQAMGALKSIYGVSYTYHNSVPSDDTILNSIKTLGRPLYSAWSGPDGGHATVICGVNVLSGYITIMNPASGFMTATTNGSTYTYISVNNGNRFTLYGYAN